MTLPPLAVPPEQIRRIVYLGTPSLAVEPLLALHAAGYDIPLVVSQPDKRRGRGGDLVPSPVKAAALELGIEVTDDVDSALGVRADLGVVVAFGRIIRPHVLAALPMVNLHFSLLPRWRGAAPVERAILAGDPVTGVCVMVLDHELDTGGVYRRAEVEVGPDETLDELRGRLVTVGTELLLDGLDHGLGAPVPQFGEPVWADKIRPEELEIDWARSAEEIVRVVRLGRAWTTIDGRRLKILRARVADDAPEADRLAPGALAGAVVGAANGAVELLEVQAEGRRPSPGAEWARGARLGPGAVLGR